MGRTENAKAKIEYGLEICKWLRSFGLTNPFLSQVNIWQGRLEEALLNKLTTEEIVPKDVGGTGFFQLEPIPNQDSANDEVSSFICESGRHYVGDQVDVKVLRIMPYGVIAGIDESIHGLIHISEIDNRYIEDVYSEFTVDEVCPARIIAIDEVSDKIALSTRGLGKFL